VLFLLEGMSLKRGRDKGAAARGAAVSAVVIADRKCYFVRSFLLFIEYELI